MEQLFSSRVGPGRSLNVEDSARSFGLVSGVANFNHFQSFSSGKLLQADVAWYHPGKGEEYQLFWPDTADLVRLAAKANATIVPFSGVGSDEHLGWQ